MLLHYFQLASLIITLFIGLMLALSRVHALTVFRRYELSRWMIVASMFIFAVHYALQMVFGFRDRGDDVGAIVNILFYAPVAYLLSFAVVNLSSGNKFLKRHIIFSIISYVVILLTFIIGVAVSKSLHLGVAMYMMGVEFFLSILFALFDPFSESRRIRRLLESDTAGDLRAYNQFMLTGTSLLLGVTLLTPLMIFYRNMLFVVGPIFLLIIFFYAVNFLCLGFNLRGVADVLDGIEINEEEEEEAVIEEADDSEIKNSIDSWIAKGGFANPDISLSKLSKTIGCSSTELGHFITDTYGVTFRVWMSRIRLEEAKRILVSNPDATIESVAEDCGFSSRSYFQNLFKTETGFTPREYRSRNVRS